MFKCHHEECENHFDKVVTEVDLTFKGLFCEKHGKEIEKSLKESRFVEEYKGNEIYFKGGKYYPYWGSQYYFDSLEDVRKRIDNSHVAIINKGAFKLMSL